MSKTPTPDAVRDTYAALPEDARKSVADFLAFLSREYAPPRRAVSRVPLSEDPAIGIWKDRADMEDSVEYVRALRRSQWRNGKRG